MGGMVRRPLGYSFLELAVVQNESDDNVRRFLTLGVYEQFHHIWNMHADFISKARQSRERAHAARQSANDCKRRAAILFSTAEQLLVRFDELERRMLLKGRRGNRMWLNRLQ